MMLGSGEKVTEGVRKVLGQGSIYLQLLLDIDADAEAHRVVGRAVGRRIGEYVVVAGAGHGVVGDIPVGDFLLPAHAQYQPIPPDVPLDAEGDQTAADGLIPVGPARRDIILRRAEVASAVLVEHALHSQPEESAVKGYIHPQPEMQLGVGAAGSV